ncbi:flowering time control protein FPA [Senna tora]|uniref:Flowering time control protein FPA n=1 Tax=Senna tora TaxID=362788 RepID=A0A834WVV5_9FABA|nr:flowering time control protein FPA [Senna tora]
MCFDYRSEELGTSLSSGLFLLFCKYIFCITQVVDKPSTITRDEDYSWDERTSARRGSPFTQRETRGRYCSPEPLYPEKSKMTDKNPEPSEVLWIGFPSVLNVDELALRKAFSPFGEIEKITTFPGRSYAFVRFRSLSSARRARDHLQGKLFGNPRVHICFAKSEAGSSSSGRTSINTPSSPFYTSGGRHGSSENLRQDRSMVSYGGDHRVSSPKFSPNWDSGDSDAYDFNRRGSSWAGEFNSYEQRRVGEKLPPLGLSQERFERQRSPSRDRHTHLGNFPKRFSQKHALFEDPRDMPEDVYYHHDGKRLKTSSLPPERELPEYPLSELERQQRIFPKLLPDFPQHVALDRNMDAGPVVHRQTFDPQPNSPLPRSDRGEHWKPYDSFQMAPGALQSNPVDKRRLTPESSNSSLTEWKWEGTIAKGGTPVCRARCFPVGKVLDIRLPEFLDCTARTGLDMLSKHYYQAAGAWVIFFVPESDVDIEYYNEFMRYLEEKRRAAVAKLDDRNTLFLVPPSDFSEKVLKVPGKLSISGVVLRLEHPGPTPGFMHNQHETRDENLMPYHGDTMYTKPLMPSGPSPPFAAIPELGKSGMGNLSFPGNKNTATPPTSAYPIQQQNQTSGSNWSSNNLQTLISHRNSPLQLSNGAGENSKSLQEMRPLDSLSVPGGSLQQEQLAQLAASLLEQQRQSGSTLNVSTLDDPRQTNRLNGSDTSSRPSQNYAIQNNAANPEPATTSQYGQREPQRVANGNQQNSLQDDAEGDPQKRLQATLQLAARILSRTFRQSGPKP